MCHDVTFVVNWLCDLTLKTQNIITSLLSFSCRSSNRRTSSWNRSWTNCVTSSGRSTPCWPSGAEAHTNMQNGRADAVVDWTCDGIPRNGSGCTLQRKWGRLATSTLTNQQRTNQRGRERWGDTGRDGTGVFRVADGRKYSVYLGILCVIYLWVLAQ